MQDDSKIEVHKRSCDTGTRLKSSSGKRILTTNWSTFTHTSFEAMLEMKGIDSLGVLNTITRTISEDFNVNILSLLVEVKDGVFEGKIKLQVRDVADIQRMCSTLTKNKNIKSVTRAQSSSRVN
jgi:GTP pyrophosphokinase